MKYDTIVIGAGAAGLLAAQDLLKAGLRVCLLEAAATAGGRMATLQEPGFKQAVETGAEFIHGTLPLTLALLDQAAIAYTPVQGNMASVRQGKWQHGQDHDKHWTLFMHQLGKLQSDMSIAGVLTQYFSGAEYMNLRSAVQHYAEGFDLADISRASAMAAQREWGEEGETQYRIPGGYGLLVDYLLQECIQKQVDICYNHTVQKIEYARDSVTIYTGSGVFTASKLLITVSAGILQSGKIEFVPALSPAFSQAIQSLGFGNVIKILMEFATPFWKTRDPKLGFLLSDELIPTWWTQLAIENNLFTGWLGGPGADAQSNCSTPELLQKALQSLSSIFKLPLDFLQEQLLQYKVLNWRHNPFTIGGYSYNTVESVEAKRQLAHPLLDTIFFAGEAMYSGSSQGTVEAALQSGRAAAKAITIASRAVIN